MRDDLEEIARFRSEREARQALELLTTRGIGGLYDDRPVDPEELGLEPDSGVEAPGRFTLLVVPTDADRARDLLGLPPVEGAEAEKEERPQWVYIVGIFVVAMIVIPVAAFFLSYKLSGG